MKNAGFSLLEVLIAWSILSIALLAIVQVLNLEISQTQKIYQSTLIHLQVRETLA